MEATLTSDEERIEALVKKDGRLLAIKIGGLIAVGLSHAIVAGVSSLVTYLLTKYVE